MFWVLLVECRLRVSGPWRRAKGWLGQQKNTGEAMFDDLFATTPIPRSWFLRLIRRENVKKSTCTAPRFVGEQAHAVRGGADGAWAVV